MTVSCPRKASTGMPYTLASFSGGIVIETNAALYASCLSPPMENPMPRRLPVTPQIARATISVGIVLFDEDAMGWSSQW